ncbi:hypothetical protein J6590_007344 [Homalodisca vitripennis]|nr:hypothetical protein J6590_007344 [Homalodisca vitripennis]
MGSPMVGGEDRLAAESRGIWYRAAVTSGIGAVTSSRNLKQKEAEDYANFQYLTPSRKDPVSNRIVKQNWTYYAMKGNAGTFVQIEQRRVICASLEDLLG